MDADLKKRAAAVRLLVLDVDGVLTDGRLYFDNDGHEMKAFNTRDGLGIRALQRSGIEIAVITGRTSGVVATRMAQLDVTHVYQGRVDKLNAFMQLLETTGYDTREVCYAGDDWIDLPVLGKVGLAVSVADADDLVKQRVHWVTNRNGGDGAVREICNLILMAQDKQQAVLDGIMGL